MIETNLMVYFNVKKKSLYDSTELWEKMSWIF